MGEEKQGGREGESEKRGLTTFENGHEKKKVREKEKRGGERPRGGRSRVGKEKDTATKRGELERPKGAAVGEGWENR